MRLAVAVLFLVGSLYVLGASAQSNDVYKYLFDRFVKNHNKVYGSAEESEYRFQIFKRNLDYLNYHNEQGYSTQLGVTPFADRTPQEFASLTAATPFKPSSSFSLDNVAPTTLPVTNLPKSVDWSHCVTPVRNHLSAECSGFNESAVVGSIESAICINGGKLVELSTQQVVSCGATCQTGADLATSFQWIKKNGIASEQDFPFTGRDETKCGSHDATATINGFAHVIPNDELQLMAAVAKGPVVGAIDTIGIGFQLYKGGIIYSCQDDEPVHGVLIVGYGEENGVKYWKMKNWFGEDWGENGYFRLHRSDQPGPGICAMTRYNAYPTGAALL